MCNKCLKSSEDYVQLTLTSFFHESLRIVKEATGVKFMGPTVSMFSCYLQIYDRLNTHTVNKENMILLRAATFSGV